MNEAYNEAYIVRRGGVSTAALTVALGAYVTPTASGATASFDDGADGLPVKSLVLSIKPVQAGSGDPSPDNIRPISGWTSAKVTRTAGTSDSVSYTIDFPDEAGTIYGGTLDVTNGVLTVDSIIVKINDALTKSYQSAQQRFVLDFKNMNIKVFPSGRNIDGLYAESFYPAVSGANNTMFHSNTQIYIYADKFADAASFLAACGDTNIVIPITTSVTYQLTPQEVTTLLGVNNIRADAGDTTVAYRADPTIIYDKLMSSVVAMTGGT